MTELNYQELGLKCGLEIHQQLDTGKLFCKCPSILRDDKPDIIIKRQIKAAAGESGETDIAASHETEKQKTFIYEAYSDSTCLVELDEEPPQPMNKLALNVALQASLIVNGKIADKVITMRKAIANGSVVSGFQRTALVSRGGILSTQFGDVRVRSILIEEEAAKDISKTDDTVTYRLDRLGIPLVEFSTEPDIKTPEQCKECAETIGLLLRSLPFVKRGLGTIRQDVNVSIKEGDRIEIKGAQDLRMIPTFVEYEAIRQNNLIKIRNELPKGIKITKDIIDVTHIFKNSESKVIKNALDDNGVVMALKLPKFKGFVGREIQPGRRLGTEFSDRAKVFAGVGGIFHTDELPKYGITEKDVAAINKELGCTKDDAFVIVADKQFKCEIALNSVLDRAIETLQGVPKEVRKPNADGTTSFMRFMPGAARMYPETDVKPVIPDMSDITLPEMISDKTKRFVKEYGLAKDLADLISKSQKVELFEGFVKKFKNLKPAFIAELLIPKLKEVKRKYNLENVSISDLDFESLLLHLEKGIVTKNAIEEVLLKLAKGEIVHYEEFKLMSEEDIEKELRKIISENKNTQFNGLIGIAMAKLKNKADGKIVVEILKRLSKIA